MRRKLFGTRRRKVFSAILATLLLGAGVGVAALIIYSGTSGSGSGSIETSSTLDAMTINGTSNPVLTVGAAPVAFPVSVANNDPNTAHAITKAGFTATITSPTAGCASHIHLTGAYLTDPQGTGIYSMIGPASGVNMSTQMDIAADATTPLACAGATFSIAFAGSSQ